MFPSLEQASIGYPITVNGVSLFPVYIHQRAPRIVTGNASGVTITEQADAHVPTLDVHNPGDSPVLLVEGETVTGGRQNRVINVSILVPAGSTLSIPVSCIEQGRWNAGHTFGRGRVFTTPEVRRRKLTGVAENVRRSGSKHSDQGAVWSAVHAELNRLHVQHETSAFTAVDAVFARDRVLAEATDRLVGKGPLPGQCGVVVAHGSRIVAADVFAAPDMLACHWEAIVRSAVLDSPTEASGTPSATRALRFLRKFVEGEARITPGVGLGREHHVSARKLVGQALVLDDVLVHASAFAEAA